MITEKKPDLSNIRIFGCRIYTYNDSPSRSKLDDKALPGIFMGYGEQTKSWIVYLTGKNKLIASRNVEFIENGSVQKKIVLYLKESQQDKKEVIFEDISPEDLLVVLKPRSVLPKIDSRDVQQLQPKLNNLESSVQANQRQPQMNIEKENKPESQVNLRRSV